MKYLAVALNEKALIASSLQDTMSFAIYEVEDNEIISKKMQNSYGVDVQAKIDYLKNTNVKTLFINDILDDELNMMDDYGLEIYVNAEGTTDYIVDKYLSGELEQDYEEAIFKDHEEDIHEMNNIKEDTDKIFPEVVIPPNMNEPSMPYLPFEIGDEFKTNEKDDDHKLEISKEYDNDSYRRN